MTSECSITDGMTAKFIPAIKCYRCSPGLVKNARTKITRQESQWEEDHCGNGKTTHDLVRLI
jgi:hypothetical protein